MKKTIYDISIFVLVFLRDEFLSKILSSLKTHFIIWNFNLYHSSNSIKSMLIRNTIYNYDVYLVKYYYEFLSKIKIRLLDID